MNTEQDKNMEDNKEQPDETIQEEQPDTQQEELQALQNRVKELEDSYLRTHADFENTKKRLEKDKSQALEYAYESFAKELLPVLDSLEAAISSVNSSTIDESMKQKFKEGLDLTLENFYKVLDRYGITPIATEGEFNPHWHNAIMQNDSPDHGDGEIIQTLQKGYQYKERVLRPALVNVCKK